MPKHRRIVVGKPKVITEDISTNIRYVHQGEMHCVTISIPGPDVPTFTEWCDVNGMKADFSFALDVIPHKIDWGEGEAAKSVCYSFSFLTKDQIMMLKLAWSRTTVT